MVSQLVNRAMTALTAMWLTYRTPETQRHRYPNSFIVQVQPKTGDGEGLHPGGGVGLCGSKETRPDHLVCPVQQTILCHL